MKIKLLFLILGSSLSFVSCEQNSSSKANSKSYTELESRLVKPISFYQELELIHMDDRFGEWGGNTFVIRIHKDQSSKQLLADYLEVEGTIGPPPPPDPNESSNSSSVWYKEKSISMQKDNIKLDSSDNVLIENAITELVIHKIRNENIPGLSGKKNTIVLKDSSLIVKDYPSIPWSNFQKLKNSLLKK